MSVFRKKPKKAPANGVPVTPANNPQTATPKKPVVEITDADRLALLYRTMPISQRAIDDQLLDDATFVRRRRLTTLLSEFSFASGSMYHSHCGKPQHAIQAEIFDLFDEVAGQK